MAAAFQKSAFQQSGFQLDSITDAAATINATAGMSTAAARVRKGSFLCSAQTTCAAAADAIVNASAVSAVLTDASARGVAAFAARPLIPAAASINARATGTFYRAVSMAATSDAAIAARLLWDSDPPTVGVWAATAAPETVWTAVR